MKRLVGTLYFWVLVAIVSGGTLGYFEPNSAVLLKPLGDGFIALVILGFIAGLDAVRVAMSSMRVSGELLFAGLSVYLLVGILFAMLHCAVAALGNDAYSLPEGGRLTLPAGIYFSFMTQTTVGYGDILPKSDLARGLAMVQAIAGQLYLAVMDARQVGLYMANQKRSAA